MQRLGARWLTLVVAGIVLLSGCLSAEDGQSASDEGAPAQAGGPSDAGVPGVNSWDNPAVLEGAEFTPPLVFDNLRAGGEPVIAITDEGTIIVSAHPGYTHFHPTPASPELLVPSQGQSYLWRSTDGGESWTHVTLLPVEGTPNSGPRGLGQGVSDPELTIDANGRIWLTDLEALASASVSWSDDDGQTWLMGSNVASGGVVDRQWLASYEDEVYFTANYFSPATGTEGAVQSGDFLASTDGINWEVRGQTPCNGDVVSNPTTGVLYQACGSGLTISSDGGRVWTRTEGVLGCGLCEPAIDAAGNVYQAGRTGNGSVGYNISVSYTLDEGETWADPLALSPLFEELDGSTPMVWPWISAGSEGRVAVTWLAAPGASGQSDATAQWHAYTVLVIDAQGATALYPYRLTSEPLHTGAICVGTFCQATTAVSDGSDRRLGDFFETTISPDGLLHIVYSNTNANPDHGVSHVAFHKQVGGPSLVVGEVPDGFPTQG